MRMSKAATETSEKKNKENEPISNLSLSHTIQWQRFSFCLFFKPVSDGPAEQFKETGKIEK